MEKVLITVFNGLSLMGLCVIVGVAAHYFFYYRRRQLA